MVSIRVVSLMCLAGFLPATAQLVSKSVPTLSAPTDSVLAPAKADLTPEARGDILMARKMFREAIDVYTLGADSNAILSNKLGIAYHQMLQLDMARKYYVQAIRLNPKYAEAVNNLGTIYYARKQYRKSIGQYNKAIKLAPNSASIYSNLGTAQFSRKKYKEASDAYEKALRTRSRSLRASQRQRHPPAGAQRRGARQVPLLPGQDLREGRQQRARAAVYPQGPRGGLQGPG